MYHLNSDWEILDDTSNWVPFRGIMESKKSLRYIEIGENGEDGLWASDEHPFFVRGEKILLRDLSDAGILDTAEGTISFRKTNRIEERNSYDIVEAGERHKYIVSKFNIITSNCDEFAHVDKNKAEEFYKSVYPTISSGKNTKIIISSTPNGMNMFYRMWKDAADKKSSFQPLEFHWSDVPGRDEAWKEETIKNTSEEQFRQEFGNEFLGSSHTLISAVKLRAMTWDNPIRSEAGLDIMEMPIEDKIASLRGQRMKIPGHIYAICVDVSRGLGLDYSALVVIDVTQLPYKQVAKYRNNEISPILFPTVIYNIARMYNNAYVLVETSDIGSQVADILHYELEYENLVKVQIKGKQGQQVSAGHVKRIQFGVKTSATTKRIGCANLKTLIESNQLLINDADTIMELTTFVAQKDTYKAEEGYHDDVVMSLVLFGWFISQRHFKEALKNDIRTVLQQQHLNIVDDDVVPFGVIDDGLTEFPDEEVENTRLTVEDWISERQRINPLDENWTDATFDDRRWNT